MYFLNFLREILNNLQKIQINLLKKKAKNYFCYSEKNYNNKKVI